MSADKSDEKAANSELYHNDKSIVVAPDVKYVVLVTYIISIWEIDSYI